MSDELWRRVSALDDDIDQEVDERASRLNSMYEKRLKSRRDQLKAKLTELKTGEDRRFTQQTVRASAIRTSILQDVEDLEDISKKWQSALRRIGSKIEDRFKVSDESAGRFSRDDKAIIEALIGAQNKTGYIGQLIETDQYHRRVLADAVTRHVLGRTTPEQLTDDIERLTRRSSSEARRLFHDGAQAFSRTVTLSKAKKLGYKRFQYLGPEDGANRPFCAKHIDKVYTREQIDELTNKNKLDVWTYAGGYNCRHSWRPVRASWLGQEEQEVGSQTEEETEQETEEVEPKAEEGARPQAQAVDPPQPVAPSPPPQLSIAERNLEYKMVDGKPVFEPFKLDPAWTDEEHIENALMRVQLETRATYPDFDRADRLREKSLLRKGSISPRLSSRLSKATDPIYEKAINDSRRRDEKAREMADAIDYSNLSGSTLQRSARAVCVEFFRFVGHDVPPAALKKVKLIVKERRGYYKPFNGELNLGEDAMIPQSGTRRQAMFIRRVLYHELGHVLEDIDPGFGQRAVAFLRMMSNKSSGIVDHTDGLGRVPEWVLNGSFTQPYTGRLYTRQAFRRDTPLKAIRWDWIHGTEITSMAMERWSNPNSVARMVVDDPELFWWTMALQKGLL